MTAPVRTLSDTSQHSDAPRKRISKACDRCRLKKSKCNGDSPCSRCSADNAICVFGERRRAHDRVYPKGYVEMLEQQQAQLVAGLQETYRRLRAASAWPGAALDEREGRPLTHDILCALDIIHHKGDDSSSNMFEEDPERLQQRLLAGGAPYMQRRGSFSSDSDHSTVQSSHSHKRARSQTDSSLAQSPTTTAVRHSFDHPRTSRAGRQQQQQRPHTSATTQLHGPHRPSPLHTDSEADQLGPFEDDDDALMSSFQWQDMQSDVAAAAAAASEEPQFTFPDFASVSQWPGSYLDALATTQPGLIPQPGDAFTNMQQLQRTSIDLDLMGFVPVEAA